jgi:large exoprotein involved in heme utilization and adhesion
LFLVNPSGIVFGPQGSFDVGGSVSMSTANYLRFEGTSTLFDMLSSPASLGQLSVAPVVAFGFTDPEPPAPITVRGSMLQVQEGKSLSLVGGDITLQAEQFQDGTMQAANLLAPGGQVNLVAVASPGEVLVPSFQTGPNINGTSFTTMGTVMLKEGATLDVSGQLGADADGNPIGGNGGTVLVRGGQLVMEASTIQATTMGAVDGERAAVDIQVSQKATLINGSIINTITSGAGKGGDVQLTADTVTMENGALIVTATVDGDGVGGDVTLNVRTVSLTGGSSIQSQSQTVTPETLGRGGHLTIQGLPGAESGAAESVTLSGDSFLLSSSFGTGEGGGVTILSRSLTMDGAATNVKAESTDVGRGGDIVIGVQQAGFSGGATILTSTGSADPNAPAAATVTVQGLSGTGSRAYAVDLSGTNSGIISDTAGAARSGDVTVHARTITLREGAVIQTGTSLNTGAGGNVTIDAETLTIAGEARITSLSAAGNAGQVAITANQLTMNNVSIASSTSSSGRGGNVELNVVGTVSLSNGATINSSTSAAGRAGDITMNVGTLSLANGSEISSASTGTEAITNPLDPLDGTTRAPGTAGNVVITASGSFTSDGSTIATSAEANHGGDVSITAHSVELSNGSLITANSKAPLEVKETVLINGQLVEQVVGDGNAGNITVRSGSTFVMQNSAMTTEATQASGGQVVITAPEMVQLSYSKMSTSVAGSATDTAGGNITIDPQFVVLQNSQILAKAFAGSGGAINIVATSAFIADPTSIVDASSTLGISGTINIQSPVQNIGGELTALSQEFFSAAALLAQQCAARVADGKFSTFVVAAREGLPVEPGGFLASPSLTAELLGSPLSGGQASHSQLSAFTGLFPKYDARPIQLAKLGDACHR